MILSPIRYYNLLQFNSSKSDPDIESNDDITDITFEYKADASKHSRKALAASFGSLLKVDFRNRNKSLSL